MSKSFYKRLQVLLLRRWILIHVHETAIYRSEYPNPRSRNGGKNFWILSTACEQASDDTFPVSYLTKIEFYHTPKHLLNLKTSVLTLQKTRVFYNLCTEENFIRTAFHGSGTTVHLIWMRFANMSLSRHGQPAFVIEGLLKVAVDLWRKTCGYGKMLYLCKRTKRLGNRSFDYLCKASNK